MDYIELKIEIKKESLDFAEILVALLAEQGFESFSEEGNSLSAYIKEDAFNAEQTTGLLSGFKDIQLSSYNFNHIKDQNWNHEWESNFTPIIVEDNCIVRAPFHAIDKSYRHEIIIEPKMAFGTGHHETTYMVISWLIQLNFKGLKVLDMGCGTGILSILASLRGAIEVDAVDIDDWAFNNATENIQKNNTPNVTIIKGGAEVIPSKKYDYIIANINKNILLRDIPIYVKHLKNDGSIIFSGIYSSDFDDLNNICLKNQLYFQNKKEKNKWIAPIFKKL